MQIDPQQMVLLSCGVLIIAFLYSCVGHAGATGYIAVMSLFNVAPETIRPTALVLNIVVASITYWHFYRAGHFSWSLFWPVATLSTPMALAGGYILLPTYGFKVLVGIVLVVSAIRLLARPPDEGAVTSPPWSAAVALGGGLGLLAGLTGTGGGVFLTPILMFRKWAGAKTAGAVSALFILINSVAGLIGNVARTKELPGMVWFMVAAVALGGTCGSYFGSRRFDPSIVKRLLAVVLVLAGLKLILG